MKYETDMDRIRAWAEGTLSDGEAGRMRTDLARDEKLRETAEQFMSVLEITRPLTGVRVESHADAEAIADRVEELEAADRPSRRGVAAAAGVFLLVAGSSAGLWSALRAPGPIVINEIPFAAPAVPTEKTGARLAELLIDWEPTEGGAISWIDDRADAELVSQATGRPLLVFGSFPFCPWCEEMRADAFRADEIVPAMDEVVPYNLDLDKLPRDEAIAVMSSGYPFFELEPLADGEPFAFHGRYDGPGLRDKLEQGLAEVLVPETSPMAWPLARRLARRLSDALAAEDEGRFQAATAAFDELTSESGAGRFERLGRAGLARVAGHAHAALARARRLFGDYPDDARAVLRDAIRRFARTPFERDFAVILESLEARKTFPELEFTIR